MTTRILRAPFVGLLAALSLAACQSTFGGKVSQVVVRAEPDAAVYVIPHMQWVQLGRDKLLDDSEKLAAFRKSTSTPVTVSLRRQLYVVAVKPRDGGWKTMEYTPPVGDGELDFPGAPAR